MKTNNVDKLKKEFYFWVKGSWAAEHAYAFNRYAKAGVPVQFIPESTNPIDPNAILVCIKGKSIGHVTKGSCKSFLKLMAAGYFPEVKVERLSNRGDMALVTGTFILKTPEEVVAIKESLKKSQGGFGFALGQFVRLLAGYIILDKKTNHDNY